MSAPKITLFICSFTELELEMGGRLVDFDYRGEQDELAYNLHHDLAHEEQLARAYVNGESDVPWPEYADPPCVDVDDGEVVL